MKTRDDEDAKAFDDEEIHAINADVRKHPEKYEMKTDKQHLEAILAFLVKKDWDFWGLGKHPGFRWKVQNDMIEITTLRSLINKNVCEFLDIKSINDLLASHSTWEKLVGKKEVCRICGHTDIDERGTCQNCQNYNDLLPANLFHISQCFQLPEEERLKYAVQFVKGVIKY